jgi:hypothetical protein
MERVTELHVYPKSPGRVLRYIAASLEECCELLSQYHLEEILAYKQELAAAGKLNGRAHPFWRGYAQAVPYPPVERLARSRILALVYGATHGNHESRVPE